MEHPLTSDPYSLITKFWGEPLDEALADRIVAAPEAHLDVFESFLYEHQGGMAAPPALAPGHLRPVLAPSLPDLIRGRTSALDVAPLATVILLYAHEVILEDPSLFLISDNAAERRRAAHILLQLAPLSRDGAVHFRPVAASKRHPSNMPASTLGGLVQHSDDLILRSSLNAWVQRIRATDSAAANLDPDAVREELAYSLGMDASTHLRRQQVWGPRSHALLRSDAEAVVLRLLLESGQRDRRSSRLTQLLQLEVPRFDTRMGTTLVSARRQDGEFAEWRESLAAALDEIVVDDLMDPAALKTARAVLHEELEPIRSRVQKSVDKSSALSAVSNGLNGFAIAAVAGGIGFLAGGNIASALASAVAGKAIETGRDVLRSSRGHKSATALRDLAMIFKDPEEG